MWSPMAEGCPFLHSCSNGWFAFPVHSFVMAQLGNVCMSGGASGADLAWGAEARRHGHKVLHFSFAGHRTRAPRDERVILSDAELQRADPYLARASARLKRAWPPASAYAANLLRRDWYQVKDAQRVYAVARLQVDQQIEGGTAWTFALFLDRHDRGPCEMYLFEPNRRQWFSWNTAWEAIALPPRPAGLWAGIGTRALTPAGEAAIRALFAR